jgi:hypothetical protein
MSEATETVFLTPLYYLWVVLVLGFGLWAWSTGVNSIGLTRGAHGYGYGADVQAERARREVVADGLGGYATPYANTTVTRAARVVAIGIDSSSVNSGNRIVTPFGNVRADVRQGTVIRAEGFQARPPPAPGAALGTWE